MLGGGRKHSAWNSGVSRSVIFVIIKIAVLWGVGPCILVLVYQTVGWHTPENGSHCSEDLQYNFCGFLARCMVFWQDLFRGKRALKYSVRGEGRGLGNFGITEQFMLRFCMPYLLHKHLHLNYPSYGITVVPVTWFMWVNHLLYYSFVVVTLRFI
jgi:hypothetical protein